ncbi:unnamed protein product [Urochloa humidicola]
MSTPARKRLMWDFKWLQQDPPVGISSTPHDNTTSCSGTPSSLGRMTRHRRPAARPRTGHTTGEGVGGRRQRGHARAASDGVATRRPQSAIARPRDLRTAGCAAMGSGGSEAGLDRRRCFFFYFS